METIKPYGHYHMVPSGTQDFSGRNRTGHTVLQGVTNGHLGGGGAGI